MVKLELIEKEDLNKVLEWNANKSADDLIQWAGPLYDYPLNIEQLENYFLDKVRNENSNIFVYKVLLVSTGEFIGTIELREVDNENKIGRVCRFLIGEKTNRGKGIGTKVLKEALKIGFEDVKFDKITLGVFDFNKSAIRCYENSGFTKEKLSKDAVKSSTGYWSLYEMAISKDKWQVSQGLTN